MAFIRARLASVLSARPTEVRALGFAENELSREPLQDFQRRWQNAKFRHDRAKTGATAALIFGASGGRRLLDLHGTNFQLKVWEALLRIPPGALVSYGGLANSLDKSGAARAVGSALHWQSQHQQ